MVHVDRNWVILKIHPCQSSQSVNVFFRKPGLETLFYRSTFEAEFSRNKATLTVKNPSV